MDAPVVVKPETVSNNAFVNDGISFVMIKGRHPNILREIQVREVIIHPSFR